MTSFFVDIKEGPDYARGEGDIESSDDDASVSSIEEGKLQNLFIISHFTVETMILMLIIVYV